MSIERKKDIFEKFEIKINEQDIEELKGVDFANDEVFNKVFCSQQRKAMFQNKKLLRAAAAGTIAAAGTVAAAGTATAATVQCLRVSTCSIITVLRIR